MIEDAYVTILPTAREGRYLLAYVEANPNPSYAEYSIKRTRPVKGLDQAKAEAKIWADVLHVELRLPTSELPEQS